VTPIKDANTVFYIYGVSDMSDKQPAACVYVCMFMYNVVLPVQVAPVQPQKHWQTGLFELS